MAKGCFVNAVAQISCQRPLSDEWFDSPRLYGERYVRAEEADSRGLIAPAEARRMSRILKRAVCTARVALRDSGIDLPDAIITGTGMGCIENSEKFLIDLDQFGESGLKPTLFMQSTHNTISSLIAIQLKCHGYNSTYSHKAISFESALLDAWLQMRGGAIGSALVGGHDEVTPFMSRVMERSHPEYSFVSEASVSAVLTSEARPQSVCEVEEVRMLYRPDVAELSGLLDEVKDGVLLLGVSGNAINDRPYEELLGRLGYSPHTLQYKAVFGDNFSASALALCVGAKVLERQSIPPFLHWREGRRLSGGIDRLTVVNQSDETAWSVVRLKKI